MAERKAVNKYYPPDWDPRKGSVNKRVGQHPLRDRAKKLSQGILVIRFELPYNIWCGGCGNHVGMGVRYNAEKSKVGNYYSTPIYKFRMKCHLCDNYFEIQTDPKNHDYVILCGARRKEQRWDPVANEQVVPEDKATQKKLATDAMYKLEHGSDDAQKGKERIMNLTEIECSRMSMKDDYILNRMARDKFRSEKKRLKELAEADQAILQKSSLDIDLVEESEEDKTLAGLMKYSVTKSYEDKQREMRKNIELRPIFKSESSDERFTRLSSSTSSSSSSILPHQKHNQAISCRRGQIKEKLGLAIKASYKDPFKQKKSLISSQPSTASQALFGIRIKSPTEAANEIPTLSFKASVSSSDISTDKTISSLPLASTKSDHDSDVTCDRLQNCEQESLQLKTNILSPESSTKKLFPISCGEVKNSAKSTTSITSSSGTLNTKILPQKTLSDSSGKEMSTSKRDSLTPSGVVFQPSCKSVDPSLKSQKGVASSPGLNSLMTSYTDSDSNSDE